MSTSEVVFVLLNPCLGIWLAEDTGGSKGTLVVAIEWRPCKGIEGRSEK